MKRTGFKTRSNTLKASKPLRKQSPKRVAYRQSAARADGVAHMLAVKALPCICCGHPPPSYAHHCSSHGMARDDMAVLPLCYECHQGPQGYHAAKRSWVARYGQDVDLLPRVQMMLDGQM
jgi:hypothetical protein